MYIFFNNKSGITFQEKKNKENRERERELELSGRIRPMMAHLKNAIWQLVGLAGFGEMIKWVRQLVGRDAGAWLLARRGAQKMGSRALVSVSHYHRIFDNLKCKSSSSAKLLLLPNGKLGRRNFSTSSANSSSLEPPDVPRLAETARISLTPYEVSNLPNSFEI